MVTCGYGRAAVAIYCRMTNGNFTTRMWCLTIVGLSAMSYLGYSGFIMIRRVFLISRVFAIVPFVLLTLLPLLAPAQPWSGILSPSRAVDWSHAGLPSSINYGTGGPACNGVMANCTETTPNSWTPPTRVQSAVNFPSNGSPNVVCANSTTDASTINNALSGSHPGSYVLFTGTCNITSSINIPSGITLRGTGPMTATLKLSAGASVGTGQLSYSKSGALGGSYAAGATQITV